MSRQFPRSPLINLFAVLFPLLLLWSLSNPMFAAPDEPAHLLRAQGFSQFDFSSPYQTDGLPLNEIDCLRFNADATADCMKLVWAEPWNELGTSTMVTPHCYMQSQQFQMQYLMASSQRMQRAFGLRSSTSHY